jgi:hypothetical protein
MKEYKLLPDQLQNLTMLEIIMMGIDPSALEPKGETLKPGIDGIMEYFGGRSKLSPEEKLQQLLGKRR